jgi:hypothetical protein
MNKRILTLLFLIFFTTLKAYAEKKFKDVIVIEKYVCGLTSKGGLKFYDRGTGQPSSFLIKDNRQIKSITTDKLGNLVVLDKNNRIKKYNRENRSWELIATVKTNSYGLLFDSRNQCYSITDKGILNIQSNKIYYSNQSLNHQINCKQTWGIPYCYYIDKADRIWLGFGYGEWGGNLFIFETTKNEFLVPELDSFKIELWPIKSFFEDEKSIYLSSGLQHMRNSGTIVKFNNLKATTVLNSESGWSEPSVTDSARTMIEAEYIGPSTYNKFDSLIYFYSQNGFFKGDRTKDLSKIEHWINILKPELDWESGQPDAVGSPMNVRKLIAIGKGKFIFLTQLDGIGFYDGLKLKMLK